MPAVAAARLFHVKPRPSRGLWTVVTLLAILTWFTAAGALAQAADSVPLARDLAADAKLARDKNLVLLVMFGTPDGPYCRQVLNEFLLPMSRNADYQAKVVMRQVEIGGGQRLVDFSGRATTHRQFSFRHRAKLAPTVMLFDADGRVLAEPLVGMITPDYYGAFLDRAISEAREKPHAKPAP